MLTLDLLTMFLVVRSFGLGVPGTRNVYIFVPSRQYSQMHSFGHSFSERNFARYLNRFLPLYPNETIVEKYLKLISYYLGIVPLGTLHNGVRPPL